MQYYKSNSGDVYKVYACDPSTGKITIILNYKGLGMYNVLNQKLDLEIPTGSTFSEYLMYINSLESCGKSDFLALSSLAKTFIDSL